MLLVAQPDAADVARRPIGVVEPAEAQPRAGGGQRTHPLRPAVHGDVAPTKQLDSDTKEECDKPHDFEVFDGMDTLPVQSNMPDAAYPSADTLKNVLVVLRHTDGTREPNPVNLDPRLKRLSGGVQRLEGQQPIHRVDRQPHDLVRGLRGDLLDVDAAGGAHHEHRALRCAIDDDADVRLGRDIGRRGDQNLVDRQPLDAHPENLRGGLPCLLRRLAPLAVVARLARRDEVVPGVGPAAVARHDVVEREVVRLPTAVLAGVAIAAEDLAAR